jgi:hypothetical protein
MPVVSPVRRCVAAFKAEKLWEYDRTLRIAPASSGEPLMDEKVSLDPIPDRTARMLSSDVYRLVMMANFR